MEAAWVQCPEASLSEVTERPSRIQVTAVTRPESIIVMTLTWYLCYTSSLLHGVTGHVCSVRVSGTDWPSVAGQLPTPWLRH